MPEKDKLFEPVLSREKLFEGNYLDLDRYKIQLPDGKSAIREVVKVCNAVAVLPVDDKGYAHLVRQHRPAIGKTIIEVPAGLIDNGEDENDSAVRECEEETGYKPEKLIKLITYAHAEGYSTGFITLFLGLQLKSVGKPKPDSTEFFEQETIHYYELLKMVRLNFFIDSKTILSTLLSQSYLDKYNFK